MTLSDLSVAAAAEMGPDLGGGGSGGSGGGGGTGGAGGGGGGTGGAGGGGGGTGGAGGGGGGTGGAGGGGGGGSCSSTLSPIATDNPPAGLRPLTTTFDTTGTTLECGETAQQMLLFPGNGAVVPLDPTKLAQQVAYTYTIPGFYLGATYVSETVSGHAKSSPGVAVAVTRGSDGTPPPMVSLTVTNMGTPLAFAFAADVQISMNPLDPVAATLWDFGDGLTSGAGSPTHTYKQNGIYAVSYIVTTQRGMAAFARAILVISDNQGRVPASLLVGAMPAETTPMTRVQLSGFLENIGTATVTSARVIWPDRTDDAPTIGAVTNGVVIIGSSSDIAMPDEYDVPMTVTLSSGQTLTSVAHVVVTESDGTQPSPVPLSKPYGSATVGQAYEVNGPGAMTRSLLVRGVGPFSFSATESPSSVVVDSGGNVTWKPTAAQVGNQRITVLVTDATGKQKPVSWVVLVTDPKTASGCGCDVASRAPATPVAGLLLVALLLRFGLRRRKE